MKKIKTNGGLPLISIVVLNYNGQRFLKDCFESLGKINYPKNRYEVIMCDNASSDDSVAYTKKKFPRVKILRLDKNYGFCKSNNEGAKMARGEFVLFLNNDTFVTKDWLKNLVRAVKSHKDVLCAGCKMLRPIKVGGKDIIDYAGGKISPEGGGLYVGMLDVDREKYKMEGYTGFGCGAGVLIDRRFFLETGGFDEYFFVGVEEVDLGLRVWRYGHKVLFVPDSIIYHKRAGYYGSMVNPEMLTLTVRNRFYFILKNFEIATILTFLFWSFSRLFIEIPYFLLKGEGGATVGIINGLASFLRDVGGGGAIKRIIEKRREMKRNKRVSDSELRELGVITTMGDKIEYVKGYLNRVREEKEREGGVKTGHGGKT